MAQREESLVLVSQPFVSFGLRHTLRQGDEVRHFRWRQNFFSFLCFFFFALFLLFNWYFYFPLLLLDW